MQSHDNEGALHVTDLQLVRASQQASNEEFFNLIEAVSDSKGNPDPHILDKALFLTVSRYKDSPVHDSEWIIAAEKLINKGAKIDHTKIEEIWKEVKADFRDASFADEYKKMETVLKRAEQLDYTLTLPKIYAKPPRPGSRKETAYKPEPSQDSEFNDAVEVYSASDLAPEVNITGLAALLKVELRKFINQEKEAEASKELQRDIVRGEKKLVKALAKVRPKKVKKPSPVSSWSNAISQLVQGKEEKIDDQEHQFRVEHKQQQDSLKKAGELLSKLDQNSDSENALKEFCKYLADNQRRNEANDFDERLLQQLNKQTGWRAAFAIEESQDDTLRNSAITKIETLFKEKQEKANAQEQKERQILAENQRKTLEERGDIINILNYALLNAKNNYVREYKNFSWGYYFNHALTGTTAAEAKELYSNFYKLKHDRDGSNDVGFKQSQEKLMMHLLSDYLNAQGGLLSQHRDPLDEHSFGTFLLKECYKSDTLRKHFGWDDPVSKISHSFFVRAEKFLSKSSFAIAIFHALVGDYSEENMINSRSGRESMRSKMIDKLKVDAGPGVGISPAPAKQA